MNIRKEIDEVFNEVVEIRRFLHKNPEPSLEEYNTSNYIGLKLEEAGIGFRRVADTGLIACINAEKNAKTFAIRADMDALKITEKNEVSYKSQRDGYMHACGHDAHISMALGAAMVLNRLKSEIKGNVKFIFQPAEEQYGGAERIINSGALSEPEVDEIIALHVWPEFRKGSIAFKNGCIMASNDRFSIKVIGRSAHGAAPHLAKDALVTGARLVNDIQTLVSREINPLSSAVVTIGRFNAGSAYNIIAGEAVIEGTVRTIDENIRRYLEQRLLKMTEGICCSQDMKYEFEYIRQYPPTINHQHVNTRLISTAREVFGEENTVIMEHPSMAAEDYSYYLRKIPGALCFLGTGDNKYKYPLHHERFDFDEEIMRKGVEFLVQSAVDFFSKDN